jgi:anaerobic magnesium-protoporphyrin IX monomethyl ester cyclase
VARAIAAALPGVRIVYGGVFPTYHWREILADEPYVTAIVRGEGEETARRLMRALAERTDLIAIPGIAYRGPLGPCATGPAPVIRDLDTYRVGWELIDHARYSYWGGLRAVVVQFSRGCPPVHILRPARVLDALAPSRPGSVCPGTRAPSPPAWH